jgi:hypothetical protein
MSLINEALKKAQRQRSDQTTGGPDEPGSSVEKLGPMRTQSLIALGGAAAVLIILSVGITVYLVNRLPPRLTTPSPVVAKPLIRSESSAPSPAIIAPPLVSLPVTPSPTVEHTAKIPERTVEPSRPRPLAVARHDVDVPPAAVPDASPPPPPKEKPVVASAPVAVSAPAAFDARVIAFVDAIRVTGIRSSGNESKVLMNDRVYRVNDIVERALALKLVKVESDMLTFTDANGVVYTKNF